MDNQVFDKFRTQIPVLPNSCNPQLKSVNKIIPLQAKPEGG
jgi:hypothetical protein